MKCFTEEHACILAKELGSKLTHLDLSGCPLNHKKLDILVPNFPLRLKWLSLSRCDIGQALLPSLMTKLPKSITYLNLGFNKKIGLEKSLKSITSFPPNLQELSLDGM